MRKQTEADQRPHQQTPQGARRRRENADKANNTRPLSEGAEEAEAQWLRAGCKAPNWTARTVCRSCQRARPQEHPTHNVTPPRSASGASKAAPPTSYAAKSQDKRESQRGQGGSQRENRVLATGARRPARRQPASSRLWGPTAKHASTTPRQKKHGSTAGLCRSTAAQSRRPESDPGKEGAGSGRRCKGLGRGQARGGRGAESPRGSKGHASHNGGRTTQGAGNCAQSQLGRHSRSPQPAAQPAGQDSQQQRGGTSCQEMPGQHGSGHGPAPGRYPDQRDPAQNPGQPNCSGTSPPARRQARQPLQHPELPRCQERWPLL